MKYRIEEDNGKFYPQYKSFLKWNYWTDGFAYDAWDGYDFVPMKAKACATKEEAEQFIKDRITKERNQKDPIKIHYVKI